MPQAVTLPGSLSLSLSPTHTPPFIYYSQRYQYHAHALKQNTWLGIHRHFFLTFTYAHQHTSMYSMHVPNITTESKYHFVTHKSLSNCLQHTYFKFTNINQKHKQQCISKAQSKTTLFNTCGLFPPCSIIQQQHRQMYTVNL